jgi:hypothetical protein
MTIFDQTYWDLNQASLWIVFRNAELVEDSVPPINRRVPTMLMYPSMNDYEQVGTIIELSKALESENLYAHGRPADGGKQTQQIPVIEWSSLILEAPIAYISNIQEGKIQPWTDIKVKSAEVKKLWRSTLEKQSRSKFDWDEIKKLHDRLQSENPSFSRNELILELQGEFEDKFNKPGPSRTTIQRKLKQWI